MDNDVVAQISGMCTNLRIKIFLKCNLPKKKHETKKNRK